MKDFARPAQTSQVWQFVNLTRVQNLRMTQLGGIESKHDVLSRHTVRTNWLGKQQERPAPTKGHALIPKCYLHTPGIWSTWIQHRPARHRANLNHLANVAALEAQTFVASAAWTSTALCSLRWSKHLKSYSLSENRTFQKSQGLTNYHHESYFLPNGHLGVYPILIYHAVTLKPSSNPDAPPAASTATRSGTSSLEPVHAHMAVNWKVRCRRAITIISTSLL